MAATSVAELLRGPEWSYEIKLDGYLEQSFEERRRLLETLLSNCTFDRGNLCPAYVKPFDVLAHANETGDWRGGRDSCLLAWRR